MVADLAGAGQVDAILSIAREVLARPGLTADDKLADHGGTSLSIVRIIALASRALGLDVNPRDLDAAITVRGMARAARWSPSPTGDGLGGP
jgi:hypothetical protein